MNIKPNKITSHIFLAFEARPGVVSELETKLNELENVLTFNPEHKETFVNSKLLSLVTKWVNQRDDSKDKPSSRADAFLKLVRSRAAEVLSQAHSGHLYFSANRDNPIQLITCSKPDSIDSVSSIDDVADRADAILAFYRSPWPVFADFDPDNTVVVAQVTFTQSLDSLTGQTVKTSRSISVVHRRQRPRISNLDASSLSGFENASGGFLALLQKLTQSLNNVAVNFRGALTGQLAIGSIRSAQATLERLRVRAASCCSNPDSHGLNALVKSILQHFTDHVGDLCSQIAEASAGLNAHVELVTKTTKELSAAFKATDEGPGNLHQTLETSATTAKALQVLSECQDYHKHSPVRECLNLQQGLDNRKLLIRGVQARPVIVDEADPTPGLESFKKLEDLITGDAPVVVGDSVDFPSPLPLIGAPIVRIRPQAVLEALRKSPRGGSFAVAKGLGWRPLEQFIAVSFQKELEVLWDDLEHAASGSLLDAITRLIRTLPLVKIPTPALFISQLVLCIGWWERPDGILTLDWSLQLPEASLADAIKIGKAAKQDAIYVSRTGTCLNLQ